MNDPVIRNPVARIPLDSREVSAGLTAAAQRLIIVLGVVVAVLAFVAILCEVRRLGRMIEQKEQAKAAKEYSPAVPSLPHRYSYGGEMDGLGNVITEGGGR